MSAVPWCSMISGFAVSHLSLTMSHCEQAAFIFTKKTLEKHDCSEVKEVDISCCVKKKKKKVEVETKQGQTEHIVVVDAES